MLLAETRTITNTPQAKQVTWEESVTEFAGRVQCVTGIQWHGKALYECGISIRECTYHARPAPNLTVQMLNDIVGADFQPMLRGKVHIG